MLRMIDGLILWLQDVFRYRYQVVIYFDGPRTQWARSSHDCLFEEHDNVLRIPIARPDDVSRMPAPHADETLGSKNFRYQFAAKVWAVGRISNFKHIKADLITL